MIAIADILPADGVLLHLKAHSLEGAVEQLSAVAAEFTGLRSSLIYERLIVRARLGVSVGDGVLIPHARVPGLRKVVALFARPLVPIIQEDGTPITMLFVLLAPEDADAAHLKALANIAGILRNDAAREVLLTGDRESVRRVLMR